MTSLGEKKSDFVDDRILLQQLAHEHNGICRLYNLDLKPPVFELIESKTLLGRWDGRRRALGLSRELLYHMPWHISIEVLKHEIAHQVCEEIEEVRTLDHGRLFQKICEDLQVKYLFRKPYSDLEQLKSTMGMASHFSCEVKEKIRKLLALSTSENENESSLALDKAQQLMQKHGISYSDENTDSVVHEIIETKRERVNLAQTQSIALVSRYFAVTAISSYQFDPQKGKPLKVFELVGKQKDVAVAIHCYFFLQQQTSSAWEKYKKTKKGPCRGAKNGFVYGMIRGFEEKLQQQSATKEETVANTGLGKSWQLTVVNDKDVVDYCKKRFPHLRKSRARTLNLERISYNRGVKTGKELNLHKAMQSSSKQKRLN